MHPLTRTVPAAPDGDPSPSGAAPQKRPPRNPPAAHRPVQRARRRGRARTRTVCHEVHRLEQQDEQGQVSPRAKGLDSVDVRQRDSEALEDQAEVLAEPVATAEPTPPGLAGLSRPLRALTGAAVAVCLVGTVAHLLMVGLYVAPVNPISQRYARQINAWIDPAFDQNWQLFAPEPQSGNWQISARTMSAGPDGRPQISPWFDLSALDNAAIKHDVFPSHTAQNTLRRAWSAYVDAFGTGDQAGSDWAVLVRDYQIGRAHV